MENIYFLIFVIVVLIGINLIYRKVSPKSFPGKKPWICFFPKYETHIHLPDSILNHPDPISSLGEKLNELKFRLKKKENNTVVFSRGYFFGDFSMKLAKVNLIFSIPLEKENRLMLEIGAFAPIFDNGGLWKLTTELKEKIENR